MLNIWPFVKNDNDNTALQGPRTTPQLPRQNPEDSIFRDEAGFDSLFPEYIGQLSLKQWTPLYIARMAAEFLAEPGTKVLDIGSGTGKFCLTAGYYHPETLFFGVEQRSSLVLFAGQAQAYAGLQNVHFIHANVTQINFKEFDHFYFYNSFYENLDRKNRIDDSIETSYSLYTYYTQFLFAALTEKPKGTRLVTYHTLEQEVPPGYSLVSFSKDRSVKMWLKS